MAKKPKISAEVGAAEMEGFKEAAAAKGVTLSEWIRAKLGSPDEPAPVEPAPLPVVPPATITEPAPAPTLPVSMEVATAVPKLPRNPLPANVAANVDIALKRAMLFESPDKLPAYQPPPRGEGPQAQPLKASHPLSPPPRPAMPPDSMPALTAKIDQKIASQSTPEARNARTEEAVRVNEHPCVHLRVGAPGNLRPGECFGTCGNQRQNGKPCFWAAAAARNCGLFNAKVAAIFSAGQKVPTFPRH